MEEIEVPVEHAQETIHEHAHGARESWFGRVALSSALLAVLAAIAALLAGHHSNEAMIDQIRSSDNWGYYQAKGIKAAVLQSKIELMESLGKTVSEADRAKSGEYKKDQEEISQKAEEMQKSSEKHLQSHNTLAKAVTFFQVAIAIAAIAVLVRRRRFWYLSLGFGSVGLLFLIWGLI